MRQSSEVETRHETATHSQVFVEDPLFLGR